MPTIHPTRTLSILAAALLLVAALPAPPPAAAQGSVSFASIAPRCSWTH